MIKVNRTEQNRIRIHCESNVSLSTTLDPLFSRGVRPLTYTTIVSRFG